MPHRCHALARAAIGLALSVLAFTASPPSGTAAPAVSGLLPANATITQVSVGTHGEQLGSNASSPSISADGRYVAFTSGPLDSADPGGVFVRDLVSRVTERVSVTDSGEPVAYADGPAMSADGRFVGYWSSSELLPGHVPPGEWGGIPQIYVFDRVARTVEIASVTTEGEPFKGSGSFEPYLSGDGRYVVFTSQNGTTFQYDIFLRDRTAGITEQVSVRSDGTPSDGASTDGAVSDDGRFVIFGSEADNLLPPGTSPQVWSNIFIRDRQAGSTAPLLTPGEIGPDGWSVCCPSTSPDMAFVGFSGYGPAGSAYPGESPHSWVLDRTTGDIELADRNSEGEPGTPGSLHSLVSADGRYALFLSSAANLVPNDTFSPGTLFNDAFLRDLQRGVTVRVNVTSEGREGVVGIVMAFREIAISRDGHTVVFATGDALVPEDTNGVWDIYAFRFTGELQAPPIQPLPSPSPGPGAPSGFPSGGGAPGRSDGGRVPVAVVVGVLILTVGAGAAVYVRGRVRP